MKDHGTLFAALLVGVGSIASWAFTNGALQCLVLLVTLGIALSHYARERKKSRILDGQLCEQCLRTWKELRVPPGGGACLIPPIHRSPLCPMSTSLGNPLTKPVQTRA